MALRVAVAGASGYVGGELLRLIAAHPEFELGAVTAHSSAGSSLGSVHPHLSSFADRVLVDTEIENLRGHDVVFLAMPHGESAAVAALLDENTLVVDCAADHRLVSAATWSEFYEGEHPGAWPYGLPELTLAQGGKLRGRLRDVKRIAVPGCNVTAVTLALAPGLTAGLFEPNDLVAVLSVGTSGAGKSLRTDLLAAEVHGSARAYGVGGVHRHVPEIEQNLAWAAGVPATISFTPVLVPMSRGILAVAHAKLSSTASFEQVEAAYRDAYHDEPFIRLLASDQLPTTASVLGVNTAAVALRFDRRSQRVTVVCAIDNLVKGTAGAAVQSANLALGLSEITGLAVDGVAP